MRNSSHHRRAFKVMEKVQFKIGGMSCSFCTETIKRAVGRIEGVHEVHVSLAHEETLILYDPSEVAPQEFKNAITDVGYTVQDPDKIRTFEEQEEEIQQERDRLIIAASLTGIALLLMLLMWVGRMFPYIQWITLGLALVTVFIVGRPILRMAWGSLRRGILNQHVLLEFAAFAALPAAFWGFFFANFPPPTFSASLFSSPPIIFSASTPRSMSAPEAPRPYGSSSVFSRIRRS